MYETLMHITNDPFRCHTVGVAIEPHGIQR